MPAQVHALTVCIICDDLLQLLAGDRADCRYYVGAIGVRVLHALLWTLDSAGSAAHQTDTVAGSLRRAHNGP